MRAIATPNKIKRGVRLGAGFQSPRCIGVIDKIAASARLNRPPKSAFELAKADMSLHSHNVCFVPNTARANVARSCVQCGCAATTNTYLADTIMGAVQCSRLLYADRLKSVQSPMRTCKIMI